jgi:hypothetical protein
MPLTYRGFFLGTGPELDTVEGNSLVENASAIVGQTYGSAGDALVNDVVTITSVNVGGSATALDQDNNAANDIARIDDGSGPVDYVFDSVAAFGVTITYIDGTTANVTAVIFQTVDGRLYAVPSPTAASPLNSAMTAAPIRSITVNNVVTNSAAGLAVDRALLTFPTCFARGTLIDTREGPVAVEALRIGSVVPTLDGDALPIRWIGVRRFDAVSVALNPRLRPVRIEPGALAPGLPARALTVSQQHRLYIRSAIARRVCGSDEVLVPALALVGVPGVAFARSGAVEYWHFAFDRHAVVRAEGAAAESLYPGPMALASMTPDARAEVRAIFPDLDSRPPVHARPSVPMQQARRLAERHIRNARAFV